MNLSTKSKIYREKIKEALVAYMRKILLVAHQIYVKNCKNSNLIFWNLLIKSADYKEVNLQSS
jgi:hypothetical protein